LPADRRADDDRQRQRRHRHLLARIGKSRVEAAMCRCGLTSIAVPFGTRELLTIAVTLARATASASRRANTRLDAYSGASA